MKSGSRGIAGTWHALDDETVASTATVNSDWKDCSSGEAFSVWATLASTGTPDVNIFVHMSPFFASTLDSSTTTASYVAHKMVDALATKTALQGPYHANNNADNKVHLDYPFRSYRISVTGDGSNPSDTSVNVWVTEFN